MNDPHVVSLTYRVEKSETVDYDRAKPVHVDRGAFRITIDAYKAKVEMVDHFSSVKEAREMVDPYLRLWEFQADLADPSDRLRFVYETSDVIDRKPVSGATVVLVGTESVGIAGFDAVAHVGRGKWPDPPQDLALSFDADAARRRWIRYKEQGEPLLAAAYWALTMLEAAPGTAVPSMRQHVSRKRQNASAFFNIALDVLNKLGELTSTRGDEADGRKAGGQPLSSAERKWVEATFREIVRRVAQREHYGAPPPQPLNMVDLPTLPP